MTQRHLHLLAVLFPLLCGMIGCGEKPEPVVTKPDPATKKPEVAESQLPSDAPRPAKAPFDADQAKQHQQAWADYRGVPAEITNNIGMKLRLIPPGEFMMGSPDSDGDAGDEEKPQHKVRITKPFYLGVCEVTQAEYEKVVGKTPVGSRTEDFSRILCPVRMCRVGQKKPNAWGLCDMHGNPRSPK